MKYLLPVVAILLFSCGESKEELREQIAERDALIVKQKREINDLEMQVQELQEKLENISYSASDIQDAIDNARSNFYNSDDLDDAESGVDDINSELDEY